MTLKTVDEHEATYKKFAKIPGNPTGVACPKCGCELFRYICCSITPPEARRKVFCRECSHETSIG